MKTNHPDILNYTLSDEGVLQFNFPQIFLPDSTTDYEWSNGYIMYSIRPDSTLNDFILMENTAHIYFDFNPAIVTNTTINSVVDEFPTSTSELDESHLALHPNPTSGLVFLDKVYDRVTVGTSTGKIVLVLNKVDQVNLPTTVDGIYIIQAHDGKKMFSERVVLSRQ